MRPSTCRGGSRTAVRGRRHPSTCAETALSRSHSNSVQPIAVSDDSHIHRPTSPGPNRTLLRCDRLYERRRNRVVAWSSDGLPSQLHGLANDGNGHQTAGGVGQFEARAAVDDDRRETASAPRRTASADARAVGVMAASTGLYHREVARYFQPRRIRGLDRTALAVLQVQRVGRRLERWESERMGESPCVNVGLQPWSISRSSAILTNSAFSACR